MLLVQVLLVISFIQFDYQMRMTMAQYTHSYIQEEMNQSLYFFREKILSCFVDLKSWAMYLTEHEDLSEDAVATLLANKEKAYPNTKMSITTPDGVIHFSDGTQETEVNEQLLSMGKEGVNFMLTVEKNRIDGNPGVCFCVPIMKGPDMIGILSLEYPNQVFSEFCRSPMFEGQGEIKIIDSSGTVVATSNANSIYTNYWDEVLDATFSKGLTLSDLKESYKEGKSGILSFKRYGKEYYHGYTPVGMNDWILLVSVSETVFRHELDQFSWYGLEVMLKVGAILIAAFFFFFLQQRKNARDAYKTKQELEALAANVPGGIFTYTADLEQKFGFISDGLLHFFGYTEEEFRKRTNNVFLEMVHPFDREKVQKEIQERMKGTGMEAIEYRICSKDGVILWLYDKAQIITDYQGQKWFHVLVMDVTDRRMAQEEIRMNEKRYQMIVEKSDNIIWEWHFDTDTVSFSDVWEKKMGYTHEKNYFYSSLGDQDMIHPEDLPIMKHLLDEIREGLQYGEEILRFKKLPENRYIWLKVFMMCILDKEGNPSKALGIAMDVDEQMRQADEFRMKAERDSLTKLYNRGTVETLIEDFLSKETGNRMHAFIIMDVDNFKGVNDGLGHVAGDALLQQISQKLLISLRETDIIGRLGGDEFVVFLKNMPSKESGAQKAQEICNDLNQLMVLRDYAETSVSLGVAFYPNDGFTYHELYEKADIALYNAKRKGKNTYQFYEE